MSKEPIWVRHDETSAEYNEVWFYDGFMYIGTAKVERIKNTTWTLFLPLIYPYGRNERGTLIVEELMEKYESS